MRSLLVRYGGPFLAGVAGLFVALLLVHAYFDHMALHQAITWINTVEQKAAAAAKPADGH